MCLGHLFFCGPSLDGDQLAVGEEQVRRPTKEPGERRYGTARNHVERVGERAVWRIFLSTSADNRNPRAEIELFDGEVQELGTALQGFQQHNAQVGAGEG